MACPNTKATNSIAVPAAELAGSMSVVHAMSDEVAAVNPHPKTTHATSAIDRCCGCSTKAAIATAITVQLRAHASTAASVETVRAVAITAVAPNPSAIQAAMVSCSDPIPVSTRKLRPYVQTALDPAPIRVAATRISRCAPSQDFDRPPAPAAARLEARFRSVISTAAANAAVSAPIAIQARRHSGSNNSARTNTVQLASVEVG